MAKKEAEKTECSGEIATNGFELETSAREYFHAHQNGPMRLCKYLAFRRDVFEDTESVQYHIAPGSIVYLMYYPQSGQIGIVSKSIDYVSSGFFQESAPPIEHLMIGDSAKALDYFTYFTHGIITSEVQIRWKNYGQQDIRMPRGLFPINRLLQGYFNHLGPNYNVEWGNMSPKQNIQDSLHGVDFQWFDDWMLSGSPDEYEGAKVTVKSLSCKRGSGSFGLYVFSGDRDDIERLASLAGDIEFSEKIRWRKNVVADPGFLMYEYYQSFKQRTSATQSFMEYCVEKFPLWEWFFEPQTTNSNSTYPEGMPQDGAVLEKRECEDGVHWIVNGEDKGIFYKREKAKKAKILNILYDQIGFGWTQHRVFFQAVGWKEEEYFRKDSDPGGMQKILTDIRCFLDLTISFSKKDGVRFGDKVVKHRD